MSYFHVWFVTKYRKTTLEGEIEKFAKDIFAGGMSQKGEDTTGGSPWRNEGVSGQLGLVGAK